MGSAQAMVPALQELIRRGYEVVTFGVVDTPGYKVFSGAGFNPKSPNNYGQTTLTQSSMFTCLTIENPDLVLVGIATPDGNSSEKLALGVATATGINTACIIEAWPHLYLENYAKRDFELYKMVDKFMVFDEISKARMIEAGFLADRVVVTGVPTNDQLTVLRGKKKEARREFREKFKIPEAALLFTYAVTMNVKPGEVDIPHDDPRYMGFEESDVVQEFLRSVCEANAARDVRAIIRIKPGRDPEPFIEFARSLFPGKLVVGSEHRDGNQIICASDVMVGTTTIMLQTAAFLGVFPVSYMPSLNRPDPQIANTLGVVRALYEEGDLRNLLLDVATGVVNLELAMSRLAQVNLPTNATTKVADCIVSLLA